MVRPPLLGVDLVIVRLRESVVALGTTMSASCIGWAEGSSDEPGSRVRLSARRWTMVLSCRTAPARERVTADARSTEEFGSAPRTAATALAVSMLRLAGRPLAEVAFELLLLLLLLLAWDSQSAGVGGTGPKVEPLLLGGGRLVGGDAIGSLDLLMSWTLCDRDAAGGGPGGGGGRGIPGSHLVWEADRDLAEVGVSIAPVDTARRAPGGPWDELEPVRCGVGCTIGIWIWGAAGLGTEGTGGTDSGGLDCSWWWWRRKDKPKRLSRELPRPVVPGGGGKDVCATGSGDGRWMFAAGIRGVDVFGTDGESKLTLPGRC